MDLKGKWMSDLGNGRYKNPILYADYSDSDVIRVGEDFYMTASSFTYVLGLPILHSKDLVNWKIINYAARELQPQYNKPAHGCGVWALAGGVPTGWEVVLRSKNIYGSYEDRIVLRQGKTDINGPHQDGWVELENGENWFVHF